MEVVIDTNALIYAASQKLDVYELLKFEGHTPVILSCVTDELKSLSESAKKAADRKLAKLALQLIRVKPIGIGPGNTDEIIAGYAKKNNAKVLTNDKELKCKLRSLRVGILSISKVKRIK